MEIEGLYTDAVSRFKINPMGPPGSGYYILDTEFYLFSPEGFVHRGYVLDEGLPTLDNFDFERALRDLPSDTGTYRIIDNTKIQIDWKNNQIAPTIVTKCDLDKVEIYKGIYSKVKISKVKNQNINIKEEMSEEKREDGEKQVRESWENKVETQTLHAPSQAGFNPVGRWIAQISGGEPMLIVLNPDGTFQAAQQNVYGLRAQAVGKWGFNPNNQMLQLQGLVNGYQPFLLGITIRGQQNNGYFGTGSDGYNYFITRA